MQTDLYGRSTTCRRISAGDPLRADRSLREIYYASEGFSLRLCALASLRLILNSRISTAGMRLRYTLRRCQPSGSCTNWTSKRVPLWPTVGPYQLRKISPRIFSVDSWVSLTTLMYCWANLAA